MLDVEVPDVPVWVMGDVTRLTQVLDNLLQNSLKFTDQGGERLWPSALATLTARVARARACAMAAGPKHPEAAPGS